MSRTSEELQRLRRIETRLTQFMVAMGIDVVGSQKPEFREVSVDGCATGVLVLPSQHTTMSETLDKIPASWDGPVSVFVGDRFVATISKT